MSRPQIMIKPLQITVINQVAQRQLDAIRIEEEIDIVDP